MEDEKIICWWSGGIASAVACFLAIETFGKDKCRVVMIDTGNEHKDTYRFKDDCQEWYGIEIETITQIGRNKKYGSIEDVWFDFNSLNVAQGAICSSELKREVRVDFQRKNAILYQVFGFDNTEINRANNIKKNYPKTNPIFPLLLFGYSKEECVKITERAGVKIPEAYTLGFRNNNCLATGCVRGGIGYWKKYREVFPDQFHEMAMREWKLSEINEKPTTICKDQSKEAKTNGRFQVFLKKNPEYPEYKCIDDIKSMVVEPLVECNGFCGMSDGEDEDPTSQLNLF